MPTEDSMCLACTAFVNDVDITEQDVIKTANIKSGEPVLMLNKEEAISNIENKYPKLKVVQIKTINLNEIEIVVRERFSLYYISANESYKNVPISIK